MAWIESHQSLARHPKTSRAARLLGVKVPALVGHLHLLWYWALDYAQDGRLGAFESADIAEAAMWEGNPETFVDALVLCAPKDESGFLERLDGDLVIHDWREYAGKLLDKREDNAARKRAERERRRTTTPASSGAIGGDGTGTPPRSNVDDSLLRKAETRGEAGKGPDFLGDGAPEDVSQPGASHHEEIHGTSIGRPRDVRVTALPTVPNPTVPEHAPAASPRPVELVDVWNRARGGLPLAKALPPGREKHARARLKAVPDLPRWEAAVARLAASDFANGSGAKGWRATFDFLLQPDSLTRIEEGQYDNRNGKATRPSAPLDVEANARKREAALAGSFGVIQPREPVNVDQEDTAS